MRILALTDTRLEFAAPLNVGYSLLAIAVVLAEAYVLWIGVRGLYRLNGVRGALRQTGGGLAMGGAGLATYLFIAAAAAVGLGALAYELGFRFVEVRVEGNNVTLVNYLHVPLASLPKADIREVEFTKDNPLNGYCTVVTVAGRHYCSVRFKDVSLVGRLRQSVMETDSPANLVK